MLESFKYLSSDGVNFDLGFDSKLPWMMIRAFDGIHIAIGFDVGHHSQRAWPLISTLTSKLTLAAGLGGRCLEV